MKAAIGRGGLNSWVAVSKSKKSWQVGRPWAGRDMLRRNQCRALEGSAVRPSSAGQRTVAMRPAHLQSASVSEAAGRGFRTSLRA